MKTATSAPKVPEEVLKALGLSALGLLGLLYYVVLVALRGWCISKLWLWFIVPLGVPAIGVLWAIGLAMTVSVVGALDRIESSKTCIQGIIGTLMAAGIGWMIHCFM